MNNNYLKEVVFVNIGPIPGISVGTVNEYINLNEAETAKLLYQRLNRNRPSTRYLSIVECTEYAQEIRNGVLSKYLTGFLAYNQIDESQNN